jgi:putative transposase
VRRGAQPDPASSRGRAFNAAGDAFKVPRIRNRGDGAEKVRFTSTILPPYLRNAKSIEICAMPNLSKICSTRDFQEALAALLGSNAASLSSTTISRLKADWWDDYDRWQRRDLSTRRFACIWADGVYFRPRMAKEKQCVLVLLGADEWGHERTALLRASSPPFGIKPAKPKAD